MTIRRPPFDFGESKPQAGSPLETLAPLLCFSLYAAHRLRAAAAGGGQGTTAPSNIAATGEDLGVLRVPFSLCALLFQPTPRLAARSHCSIGGYPRRPKEMNGAATSPLAGARARPLRSALPSSGFVCGALSSRRPWLVCASRPSCRRPATWPGWAGPR